MAVFTYVTYFNVDDDEDVILEIKLPDPGTAAHHIIDLPPGNQDIDCLDQCSRLLGKGVKLKAERSLIFSKVVNLDSNNSDVKVNYYINGEQLTSNGIPLGHSNPKIIDASPQIIVNLYFK